MDKCPVCSGVTSKPFKRGVTSVYSETPSDMLRCAGCDNIFVSPMPTPKELNRIYGKSYSYDVHLLIEREKLYRTAHTASYIKSRNKGKGEVIEIGSMFGHLLEALGKLGVKASGIELDKRAVAIGQKKGVNLKQSSLEAFLKTSKKRYSTVVMSHVLEHILDPAARLEDIKKLITGNGRLILIVPNSSAFTAKLSGKYWGYWQVPVHVNHFNRRSLTTLLERSGFTVVDTRFRGGDSLLFLSTIANLAGATGDGEISLSGPKKAIIKLFSAITKYWYRVGNDDLIIEAVKIETGNKEKS